MKKISSRESRGHALPLLRCPKRTINQNTHKISEKNGIFEKSTKTFKIQGKPFNNNLFESTFESSHRVGLSGLNVEHHVPEGPVPGSTLIHLILRCLENLLSAAQKSVNLKSIKHVIAPKIGMRDILTVNTVVIAQISSFLF